MCVNCMSNAEAALAAAGFVGYAVKGPVHRALAAADLAPDPDPVEVLGADVVAQTEAWSPETSPSATWVPFRERACARSLRPRGSQRLIAAQ